MPPEYRKRISDKRKEIQRAQALEHEMAVRQRYERLGGYAYDDDDYSGDEYYSDDDYSGSSSDFSEDEDEEEDEGADEGADRAPGGGGGEEDDADLVQVFGPAKPVEAPTYNLAAVAAAEAAEAAEAAAAAEAAVAAAAARAAAEAEAAALASTGALERAMVETLVLRRSELRGKGEYEQADGIAERLGRAGVVLLDEGGETSWTLGQ